MIELLASFVGLIAQAQQAQAATDWVFTLPNVIAICTAVLAVGVAWGTVRTQTSHAEKKENDIRTAMTKGFAEINTRIDGETLRRDRENSEVRDQLREINGNIADIWRALGTVEGKQSSR